MVEHRRCTCGKLLRDREGICSDCFDMLMRKHDIEHAAPVREPRRLSARPAPGDDDYDLTCEAPDVITPDYMRWLCHLWGSENDAARILRINARTMHRWVHPSQRQIPWAAAEMLRQMINSCNAKYDFEMAQKFAVELTLEETLRIVHECGRTGVDVDEVMYVVVPLLQPTL